MIDLGADLPPGGQPSVWCVVATHDECDGRTVEDVFRVNNNGAADIETLWYGCPCECHRRQAAQAATDTDPGGI